MVLDKVFRLRTERTLQLASRKPTWFLHIFDFKTPSVNHYNLLFIFLFCPLDCKLLIGTNYVFLVCGPLAPSTVICSRYSVNNGSKKEGGREESREWVNHALSLHIATQIQQMQTEIPRNSAVGGKKAIKLDIHL